MYTFTDQGGRSLTLRPEGTAPIARAYVEHGMHRDPQPVKLYTVAPMYRYAAPQKGRFREHWQCSVEAIGSADPAVDAEVIQLYTRVRAARRDHAVRAPAELDRRRRLPAGVRRAAGRLARRARRRPRRGCARQARHEPAARVRREEPGRAGGACRTRRRSASRSARDCEEHFAAVRRLLDAYGVAYTLEPTLVRGLDYYTRTVFEFVGPEEKAQSAICSGGRYDGLIEEIGGPPTPGHRLRRRDRAGAARARAGGRRRRRREPLDVFFVVDGGVARRRCWRRWPSCAGAGLSADTDYAGRSFKGQMTQAGRTGARAVVIAGADGWRLRRRASSSR